MSAATEIKKVWYTRDGSEYPEAGEAPVGKNAQTTHTKLENCHRCGGAGGAQYWPGWICYACSNRNPTRQPYTTKLYNIEKLTSLNAARDKRAAKKAEALAGAVEDFCCLHPDETESLKAFATGSEFLTSLLDQMNRNAFLSAKQIASILPAIAREAEWAKKKKAEAEKASASEHIGTIKERRDFSGTVRFVYSGEGNFGTFYIYTIDTDEGTVVYKGSAALGNWTEDGGWEPRKKGDAISLKATIKAHDYYKGEKQTIIARPKVAAN